MSVSRTPNHEDNRNALIAALHPDASVFGHVFEGGVDRLDWAWVAERARQHKVGALVAARIEAADTRGRLPQTVRALFRTMRDDARRQADRARLTLHGLTDRFGSASIPFLVVKGSVLAEHVYHDACARRFFDVDIVVRPHDVDRAERLLRSDGYRVGQTEKLLAIKPQSAVDAREAEALTQRFYERFDYELPLTPVRKDGRLAVDVHWHVAPAFRLRATAEQLWEHTTSLAIGDLEVRTFDHEATLLHLAVHATTCPLSGFRLLHLCDVAWAAERRPPRGALLWRLAESWGVSTHLARVMTMVERVLAVPIPVDLRPSQQPLLGPWFDRAARPAFLLDGPPRESGSALRRARRELVWGLGMRCLSHNLRRSMRVRLARLEWRLRRRERRHAE